MSGRTVTTPAGETLSVPDELDGALVAAVRASSGSVETFAQWRTAFGDALTAALHEAGLILVARGFSTSRELVSVNLYSLAISAKNHGERRWHEAREIFRGGASGVSGTPTADLHAETSAMIDALTGHAPHSQIGRMAGVDERLRALRLLFLGVPVEQAPAGLPALDPSAAEQPDGHAA
jgi:hypothetical protein